MGGQELNNLLFPLPHKGKMKYNFRCNMCKTILEVEQPITTDHILYCPECNEEAQRIYSRLEWILGGSAYRPDGSLREDNDYAILKG